MSQRYPTDLTEAEWSLVVPFIPAAKPGGRPRTTDMREVVNATFYILRSGCQ
jgi:putative transposase